MTRRAIMIMLTVSAAVSLAACADLFPNTYRFRLTVEVDTPQGVRSGSSVYEVRAYNRTAFLAEEAERDITLRGEAVAVDVAPGRTLFALLDPANPKYDSLATFSLAALDPSYHNDWVESAGRVATRNGVRLSAVAPPSDYPMLVTFRDIRDPKSVESVDPQALEKSFGPGIALKGITVEITDARVTTGIEKRLGWLRNGGLTLDPEAGPTINPTFAQIVYQRLFTTEIEQ